MSTGKLSAKDTFKQKNDEPGLDKARDLGRGASQEKALLRCWNGRGQAGETQGRGF